MAIEEQKKKIAFVIPSLNSGGSERVITNLANELSKKHNVTLITFVKVDPFYALSPSIKLEYCIESSAPSKNIIASIKINFFLITGLNRILKKNKSDIAIAFLTSANNLTIIASFFRRIPCIVSERTNPLFAKTSIWRKRLRRILYKRAKYTIVQTSEIKDYFAAWLLPSKLRILPNPISSDLITPNNTSETRENVIINVGRLTEVKGQDVLIKAFAALNPVDWTLSIIGEGPKRKYLEDLIQTLGMTDKIKLLGRKKNISDYYSNAGIFVFSSRFEGFPNALIEAMHMGLPCISTDCPTGPSELIKDGENGFLIRVDDEDALRGRLKKLIENPLLRDTFSKKAIKSVSHFNIKNVSADWESLILNASK